MNRSRRITLASLAGAIAAGAGFDVLARPRWQGHVPTDPADLEKHVEHMLKHLYVEVDATEAQRARLEPIVKQAARDLLPMREELRATRREGIELLSQERVDAAALEALRAKKLRLADQASRRLTRALAEAAEVLTPTQRKDLAARLARRHAG